MSQHWPLMIRSCLCQRQDLDKDPGGRPESAPARAGRDSPARSRKSAPKERELEASPTRAFFATDFRWSVKNESSRRRVSQLATAGLPSCILKAPAMSPRAVRLREISVPNEIRSWITEPSGGKRDACRVREDGSGSRISEMSR